MNAEAHRRILVRGVNWLGDAVMSIPALDRLREAKPVAHVALLTHEKLADLWHDHPALDQVITFRSGESVWSVGRRLRRLPKFDAGLVLPNSIRSALELFAAGLSVRIGYAGRWRRWFLTEAVPPRPGAIPMRKRSITEVQSLIESPSASPKWPATAHHLHQYLHLAARLGASSDPMAPRIVITPSEVRAALERCRIPASGRLLLGLNPGAEYGPAKRWPMDRFIAAALEIHRRSGACWLVCGGAGDRSLTARITAGIQSAAPAAPGGPPVALDLAGATTLRELCALLSACPVVLTNDTGPMHLAAAVGATVVVPFGSTSSAFTGPGLPGDPRHRLLESNAPCAPCFLRTCPIDFRCMNGLAVDQIVRAVLEALSTRARDEVSYKEP